MKRHHVRTRARMRDDCESMRARARGRLHITYTVQYAYEHDRIFSCADRYFIIIIICTCFKVGCLQSNFSSRLSSRLNCTFRLWNCFNCAVAHLIKV